MEIILGVIAVIIIIAIVIVLAWNIIAKPYSTNQAVDHAIITLYEKGILRQGNDNENVSIKRSRLNNPKVKIDVLEKMIIETVFPDESTKKVTMQKFKKTLKTVKYSEFHAAMSKRPSKPVEDSRKRFSNLVSQDDSALFLGTLMFSSLNDSHNHGHNDSGSASYDFGSYDSSSYSDGGSSGGDSGGGGGCD